MSEPGAAMTFLNAVPGAARYPAQHAGGAWGVLANELFLESCRFQKLWQEAFRKI